MQWEEIHLAYWQDHPHDIVLLEIGLEKYQTIVAGIYHHFGLLCPFYQTTEEEGYKSYKDKLNFVTSLNFWKQKTANRSEEKLPTLEPKELKILGQAPPPFSFWKKAAAAAQNAPTPTFGFN